MTQDEYEVGSLENAEKFAIIRMAQQAGIAHAAGIYMEHLERFAALVVAHEREACAKVCDDESKKFLDTHMGMVSLKPDAILGATTCAAAIRARGEK